MEISTAAVMVAVVLAVVVSTAGKLVVVPSTIPGWMTDAVTVLDETEVAASVPVARNPRQP